MFKFFINLCSVELGNMRVLLTHSVCRHWSTECPLYPVHNKASNFDQNIVGTDYGQAIAFRLGLWWSFVFLLALLEWEYISQRSLDLLWNRFKLDNRNKISFFTNLRLVITASCIISRIKSLFKKNVRYPQFRNSTAYIEHFVT